MTEFVYETITTEDGNHRAQVILDEHSYDMRPDGDCYGTVLYQEQGYGSRVSLWAERHKSTDSFEDAYETLWNELRDLRQVEAILRGTANMCECGRFMKYVESEDEWIPVGALVDADLLCAYGDGETEFCEPRFDFKDNPVVGFDTVELREGRLVNIVSLADLKIWGWESVEAFNTAMTEMDRHGDDPSKDNLHDFEAYANGDVYLVTVESKVIETTIIKSLDQKVIRESEHETWVEHDDHMTCHGFYGTEHALNEAKSFIKFIEDNKEQEVSA